MFWVEQFTFLLMSILKFVESDWTVLPSLTNGQTLHFEHFFIPGTSRLGLQLGIGGTFDLISFSLIFWGLLYATRGGAGNTSFNLGSCVIVLQCFLMIEGIDGSLGSKCITNTGLVEAFSLLTFSRASLLGILLALSIAESMIFGL